MRTTDFSSAPVQARAEAMVVLEHAGATRAWARGVRALAARTDGFVWSTGYRLRRPLRARGVIVYVSDEAAAQRLVATLRAATETTRVRVLTAETAGYSNGVWRAEGPQMAHIERFTPVTREVERGVEPPLVAGGPPARGRARARGPERRPPASPVEGRAMFIGATRYRGLHSWIVLSREWYPMVAKMRRLPGYVWHTVYWEAPFTLGTLAFFATRDDLLVFARLPEHRRLMQWITRGTAHGTGGYIRLHVAEDDAVGTTAESGTTGTTGEVTA